MYDEFVSVYIILRRDGVHEYWYFWKFVERPVLSLLAIGWWSHIADVWGRRPVMLISMTGTTLSYLVFVLLQQVGLLQREDGACVGIVQALDCLFGGSIAFNGLLHTCIGDCTSPGSRFKLFSALKGLSIFFYVGGTELVMLLLDIASQKYLDLSMVISSFVAVLNIVLIIWLLPETLRNPDYNLPVFKAVISPVMVSLQRPWLALALFVYALTPSFEIVKIWFGIICSEGPFFVQWYLIFPLLASAFALLLLYPAIAILYQRKARPLRSVLKFTRHLAYTCLSIDVFSTVTVLCIAASNRIAHLVFAALSPFTVAIAPAIYSFVPAHSAVLFGSFSVIEALGGMFSNMFIQRFWSWGNTDIAQYRLLYGALAICLILTGLLLFVDSTGGSVDEEDSSTVLSTHDDEESLTVHS
ncbi:uncharacterized protein BT62DRAFT_558260 [Guyanagaster necrorhizus]|uniref:Uncharacterized protein n=1 Tax=Guyanagaster necrorhizus TaxID=856835 RepID=A0A9P7VI31_9AGAR|nr:uncharacterized protein BT62DRAFT_558260 [Guyanagaster necrorhizus MCA 3950]KAG7440937.1 hypothetical protein BT62DRAFT_558260 [Guyanagaster necrorhizus MCA 3950]